MQMSKAAVLASLKEIGLVPVLRAESVEKALALAEAIAAGGVTAYFCSPATSYPGGGRKEGQTCRWLFC